MTSRTVTILRRGDAAPATTSERSGWTDATVSAALAAGVLPVELGATGGPAAAWVVDPPQATDLTAAGVAPWRVTVRHTASRADTLDVLARTGVPFLRTSVERLAEAVALCGLPGSHAKCQVEIPDVSAAAVAVHAGADDLVVDAWDDDALAELRNALPGVTLV